MKKIQEPFLRSSAVSGRTKSCSFVSYSTIPLFHHFIIPTLVFIFLFFSSAWASDVPHLGYIFPAGGVPGSTFTVTIGGQHLKNALGIHVSGAQVRGEVTDYTFEVDPKAGNRVRNMKEKMESALEEEDDPLKREQIQYQIAQAEDTMMMAKEMRMEMRNNKELYAKKQFNPQLADTLTLQITIADDVEPGAYELRVITTNGLSNHLLFDVSGLKEVFEAEPNNEVAETSTEAPKLPLLLNGQILPGDIDCFRFYAERGDDLVFRAQARALVPYLADAVPGWFQAVLTLYDSTGKEIAYVDDFRFDPDPVLICQVPENGEYILEIRDAIYRGRRDFVYRIAMGELPFIDHIFPLGGPENSDVPVELFGVNLPQKNLVIKTGGNAPAIQKISVGTGAKRSNTRPFGIGLLPEIFEAEPNNLPSQAQAVGKNLIINGRIEKPGDFDCFRFDGERGEKLSFEVLARRLDSPLDARLVLLDPQEHILAISDDEVDRGAGLITHHADSLLNIELPETGTYTLRLDDLQGKGGHEVAYRLRIGEEQPDYSLRVVPSSLTIPEEGCAVITVHALRKAGFDGPIELTLKNAPEGIELHRAIIPSGEEKTQLTLSSTGRESDELMTLEIEGEAKINTRTVRRPAVPAEDMMQAFLWRHLVAAQELLARVTPPEPASVQFDLPEGFVEARPGEEILIPLEIDYHGDFSGSIRVELSGAPEWVKLKTKDVRGGSHSWGKRLILSISDDAPAGAFATLILNGTVSVPKSEDDPTYNPIIKWVNRTKHNFVVGAVPVEIAE